MCSTRAWCSPGDTPADASRKRYRSAVCAQGRGFEAKPDSCRVVAWGNNSVAVGAAKQVVVAGFHGRRFQLEVWFYRMWFVLPQRAKVRATLRECRLRSSALTVAVPLDSICNSLIPGDSLGLVRSSPTTTPCVGDFEASNSLPFHCELEWTCEAGFLCLTGSDLKVPLPSPWPWPLKFPTPMSLWALCRFHVLLAPSCPVQVLVRLPAPHVRLALSVTASLRRRVLRARRVRLAPTAAQTLRCARQ
jgi:hypothetical protein